MDKKKNRKLAQAEVRKKNFDMSLSQLWAQSLKQKRPVLQDENIPSEEASVGAMAGERTGLQQQKHYEVRTTNVNMLTRCSRVDESFVDYL
mmetsp:Transcript_1827/g.2456  ORF Transcript_1827/g.2456 Transcript_1827/m.2456 type:complete len:91 (+) Transcript_1827:1719-1991(+)